MLSLLSLLGGNRLWELILRLSSSEDILPAIALVEMCSHTLETISITFNDCYGMSIPYLRPHGSNFFPSGSDVDFVQPLKSNKAQRRGFPARIAESSMDHPRTTGLNAQASMDSTNLD